MNDLIAFLNARLREIEQRLHALASRVHTLACGHPFDARGERGPDACNCGGPQRAMAQVAVHQKEIDTMRAVLAEHAPVVDGTQSSWAWFAGSESASSEALRRLAAAWRSHPDWREEWSA